MQDNTPPQKLRLKEAFDAAANLKFAVDLGVAAKFTASDYTATSPLKLPFGEYMTVALTTILSFGAYALVYDALSRGDNAAKDDYRRNPDKHFALMAKCFNKAVGQLDDSAEKTALASFGRAAAFAFAAEKSALLGQDSALYKKGLKTLKDALALLPEGQRETLLAQYMAGEFPAPGSFAKPLQLPVAQSIAPVRKAATGYTGNRRYIE